MTAACPPDHDLDRLLNDGLSDAEESVLEAHVSGCAACQSRLDRLTSGPSPLSAGVLEFLGPEPGEAMGNESAPASPPTTAGPRFTPLGLHAEGGLGRVHRARDEQLRRTVALKEIRPERADDDRVRRRFLNEAEITGQLEHPGIVPIYALELDAASRPVYAMRFIHGRPLTDAIQAHHRRPTALGLRELLQRYISVCQTVAYAHAHNVIHRDLKPDNILLGEYGETLVVDWGLAKRLGPDGDAFVVGPAEPTSDADDPTAGLSETILTPSPTEGPDGAGPLTVAGTVMGTPAYMAPEQARGEPLTPAADVYSLGAVLFSILTGKVPYRGTSAMEILRKVAAGEPPTAAGAPRALNAIYFKAMARDPESRYTTAAELAEDVGRWLADEPVSAHREPWPARAGRWARHHRPLVASAVVAALILAVTAVGLGWWQVRLAEARHLEQARNAEQIEALLDRGEAAIAADDAAGARLAIDDAETRAANLGTDVLTERLVRCRSAVDLLTELDRIDELRWAIADGKVQGRERALREWPGAFTRLGVVPGQTPPAEAARVVNGSLVRERLLAALEMWLVSAPHGEKGPLRDLLAAADADPFRDAVRAAVQRSNREEVLALAAKEEALRQPVRFAAALGSIADLPLARALAILGTAAHHRPQAFAVLMTAGSLFAINDAATAADRLPWFRSAVTARPGSCIARDNLGIALRDKGDLDGAIAECRAAIAIDPTYAMAHNNLGAVLSAKKDLDEAIAEYRIAISLDPRSFLARSNLGNALTFKNDLAGAVAEYRTAVALNPNHAVPHNNLAFALKSRGDLDGAIAEYGSAIRLDPNYALANYNLGHALVEKGDLSGAVAAYTEAIRLKIKDPSTGQRVAELKRWQALLPRLDGVAAGTAKPATADEAVEFSKLCRQPFLKRHAASARLYLEACAAAKKYANDPSTSARYTAARSAALAGCGQGADAPTESTARAALRRQALDWLNANQAILGRRLASDKAGDLKSAADQLTACLSEKDFDGVRPGAARDGWSAAETAAWDSYWSDVRMLLGRANEARPAPPAGR